MSIQAGLVGLPNVGKSTLFNALTKAGVPAENYPFCTIEPHQAITEVPDSRLDKLASIYGSQKKLASTVTFVDIAGLVKGAAQGEGLGNQFLGHIREVNLILHVLRCFEDQNIIHTTGSVDPLSDYETIVSELMLKDLESVEKRIAKIAQLAKAAKSKPKELAELQDEHALLEKITQLLNNGKPEEIRKLIDSVKITTVPLLSSKNFLVIANISEDEIEGDKYKNNPHYQAVLKRFGPERVIPVSAKIENELAQLDPAQAAEMMEMIGLKEPSLNAVIKQTYKNLGLITFFTCGPKEAHAWPIKQGLTIRQAAGEIHSDLERGFICSEIFNCKDIFEFGSEAKLRDLGKIRTEGQDYIVADGDIVHIRFNV